MSCDAPKIEFLYWEECPSWRRALEMLGVALDEAGIDRDSVKMRELTTEDEVRRERFVGSPTIRIDGVDVQPPAATEAYGLACRVYRRRDGAVSPLPDPEDLRQALAKGEPAG